MFVTGYGADVGLPPALAGKPRLPKPCSSEALEAALRRARPVGGACEPVAHASFGSSVVDHSATSARSRKVTVIWPVAPSILTWPKNCMPADGGRFCLSAPAP